MRVSAFRRSVLSGDCPGGYYTKTVDNHPLIGPSVVDGVFVNAAFSRFGLMVAPAVGVLVAAYITGSTLPEYAPAFALARYDDPR